jgi:3'-phosphoadenosine 5'-phosphosulfate sulfotransferase (PAPS reductase)/FAD synthetase
MMVVIQLFPPAPPATPDLTGYDLILVNSSAGKDSQAMLDVVVHEAERQGVRRGRLVVVHADLGRVEWPGTKELAAEHAAHYGLPFETVRNRNWSDLLERIESRGMWPGVGKAGTNNRYCTSEFKTAQVRRLMTALVKLRHAEPGWPKDRKVRILNCLGVRAQESRERAKREPFSYDEASSNKTLRDVDEWLPIFAWSVDQVWARIRQAGTRHHYAYDLGMPRVSCVLCVYATPAALTIGAKHNPDLAADYAAAERRMGHTFRDGFSIAELVDRAATADMPAVADDWSA